MSNMLIGLTSHGSPGTTILPEIVGQFVPPNLPNIDSTAIPRTAVILLTMFVVERS